MNLVWRSVPFDTRSTPNRYKLKKECVLFHHEKNLFLTPWGGDFGRDEVRIVYKSHAGPILINLTRLYLSHVNRSQKPTNYTSRVDAQGLGPLSYGLIISSKINATSILLK